MTSATGRRHLVGVWNPSYEADAMDAHVSLLLRRAREYRAGERDEDDVYVWWGKLRSPYRQEPLPHLDDILAMDDALGGDDDEEGETHLYLTDYRSLYVAHLGGIAREDMRESASERPYIPDYYFDLDRPADCWFQLWDIRRLVLDDTPAVIDELRHLRNLRYHDQRVSLYGGMVELPLIVTRELPARWFDRAVRDQLTDGRHWVEFDAERAGAGEMQRELRENRFGNAAWQRLDPAARGFVATAEQLFRAHRGDAAFDLGTVVVDLAKAMEVQTNAILRRVMSGAGQQLRLVNVDGRTMDVATDGPFGLGDLASIIDGDQPRGEWLKRRLSHGDWFVASLPAILRDLKSARNPSAHGGAVDRERIVQLRDSLVGVGCKGALLDLAQVQPR